MRRLNFLFHGHLEEEEEIILIAHKHWIFGIKFLFWPTLVFALSWAVLVLPYTNVVVITAVGVTVSGIWWLRNFFDYYLDALIVTNMGIIDVEWHGWFHRESTRVLFSDVQGVSYEIHGIAATLFRFGTIAVEKISTGDTVVMEYVPRPKTVESAILKNMEGYLHARNLADAKHVQELLSTVIAREVHIENTKSKEDDDDDDDGDLLYDDDEEYEDDDDDEDDD